MFNLVTMFAVLVFAPLAPVWGNGALQPVSEEAYTADLEEQGMRNGRMSQHRLLEVEGCLLERDAAYAFAVMMDAARTDGITLDAGDCYRSYDAQAAARSRRCEEEVREVTALDVVTGERIVVSEERVEVCEGPPTAKAGSSNHGWGRAIDFRSMGCRDEAFAWLQERGSEFGWVHPDWARCGRSSQEPWHWEWGGVREVPPVLSGIAFEGSSAFPRSYVPEGRVR